VSKIIKLFIDLLFPIECIDCSQEGNWLCESCFKKIKLLKKWPCPVCKIGLTKGKVCVDCRLKSFLNGTVISASYENETLDKAIHYLKYKGIKDLAKPLSRLIVQAMRQNDFCHDDWMVMPVPLNKRRQRWRGFNQAELIGREAAVALNLEINNDNLCRIRYTMPQTKLKRQQRLKNLINAFKLKNPAVLRGKRVILIDDVMTTGATLQECARVLKDAGAIEVWAVVLARGK
jgi:ComF family protein